MRIVSIKEGIPAKTKGKKEKSLEKKEAFFVRVSLKKNSGNF